MKPTIKWEVRIKLIYHKFNKIRESKLRLKVDRQNFIYVKKRSLKKIN